MRAIWKNFWNYRFLVKELVKKGIRLKYRRSYLGVLWSMLEPLLNAIVMAVVFGTLYGRTDKSFIVYVLSGRLIYTCFSTGTKGALKSINGNAAMIKKVYVPKYIFPLSSVLFNYVIFLISLAVLVIVSLARGVFPTVYVFGAVVPLVIVFFMTLGVGLILSTVAVFFRDMEYIWSVGLTLLMYCCAIFYEPEKLLTTKYAFIIKYNPVYSIICNFRHCIFGEPMEQFYLVYSAAFSVVVLIIGLILFRKKQDQFILYI